MTQPAHEADRNQYPLEPNTWVDGLDSDLYRFSRGLSKTGLDNINQSPAHYLWRRYHPTPSTPAQRFGQAFHCALLEPEVFVARFKVKPPLDRRTKAGKEKWAQLQAEHPDATWLSEEEAGAIESMAGAVTDNLYAAALLAEGVGERSLWWVDGETHKLCKGRVDWLSPAYNTALEVKTAQDASYTGFAKAVAARRYHVQAAYFLDGLAAVGLDDIRRMVFLVVENTAPWGVALYELDYPEMENGRTQYRDNLREYAACVERDQWPAYPPQVRTLQIPRWGFYGHAT